jgi:hypothetical protein
VYNLSHVLIQPVAAGPLVTEYRLVTGKRVLIAPIFAAPCTSWSCMCYAPMASDVIHHHCTVIQCRP